VFDDNFNRTGRILRWFSPFSVVACAFLLLSWLVVPKQYSKRHHLNFGLVMSVLFIAVCFHFLYKNEKKKIIQQF
jgi:hypothetical protein